MTTTHATDPVQLVRGSSPEAAQLSLRTVAKRARRWKRWLNADHPYTDVIASLAHGNHVNAPKLGEYIASSSPLHLSDGWNYLSRAFDAVARGDSTSAYHLAYYAELRAAMSLLATEGIGIFRNWHIALDGQLSATRYRSATHSAVWDVLTAWSNEQGRAERLLNAIHLGSQSLSEWLKDVGVVEPERQLLAGDWLRAWSIDLEVLSEDKERRNEISYRPTRIRVPASQPLDASQEMVKPLFNTWTALEPMTGNRSVALDTALMREALELVTREQRCSFTSFETALISLKGDMSPSLYDALETDQGSSAAIFEAAAQGEARWPISTPILARATLLLRLASASTAALLAAAEVSKADLEFWWIRLGDDLGHWESSTDIESFSDLWDDVAEALDDAELQLATLEGKGTVHSIASILTRSVSLTQFSRAPMWLLGLE